MCTLIEELSVFIGLTLYEKQSFPLVLCWSVKEQLDFFLVFTALDCKAVRFSSLKTHEENCGRILVKPRASVGRVPYSHSLQTFLQTRGLVRRLTHALLQSISASK